ncbi:hypothetical protein [Geodermatophilus obscurus]|uniref:Uncharacterized protein n=1 Tax=Geodermatophilus obscurus (strain ATCC 25078 / DSM 43160 / JCM 3152 / CCUG 61914 / KCC A-0152 / KCTC 9177 / NBRC 13315 / NRRL B-3577 / G-20) TaxID=526225 RepID=D2SH43_GEOOG|nr:hypothetical protein [Geodermatophilus obscurus]ADB75036.1 hypothetical protein Gobs_2360 [Geodermatophilus obscurus DSM 43160]
MDTRTNHRRRLASGVLAGALLGVPLAACGGETTTSGTATTDTSAPADDTGGATGTPAPEDTAGTSEPTGTSAGVDCTGTSCSVTISGDGAQADVLGTPVSLGSVQDGRATVRVADREVSCSQGESVAAGPLTLECTTVTADTVTLTASLG